MDTSEIIKDAAEKYMNSDKLRYFQDPCDLDVKDAYISGAKWALENRWHDLRKNPNDLPKYGEDKLCLVRGVTNNCYRVSSYVNSFNFGWYNNYDVLAWSDIPIYSLK